MRYDEEGMVTDGQESRNGAGMSLGTFLEVRDNDFHFDTGNWIESNQNIPLIDTPSSVPSRRLPLYISGRAAA